MVIGARNAVREFAQLEGAMAKFNVVFAGQAREVEAWVDEFREGVPLARREIVQAAAAMQDLLVPMGVAREDATEMTKEWLELAAALAAFNDVPVDQALEAIRSGIAGQSRPLREFGIDARETALQQTALAEGLIEAGDQMNDQVRQQALLIQSYAQSKDAVDGYEDQLGTTQLKEQELAATFKDTQAALGRQLQPAYNSLLDVLTEALTIHEEFANELRGLTTLFTELHRPIMAVVRSLDEYIEALQWIEQNTPIATSRRLLSFFRDSLGVIGQFSKAIEDLGNEVSRYFELVNNGFSQDDLIVKDQEEKINKTAKTIGDLRDEISKLENNIQGSFDSQEIQEYKEEIHKIERAISSLMGELKPETEPSGVIFDIDDALRNVDKSIESLLSKDSDFKEFFDVGTIGRMREEIQELEDQLIRTTDPEKAQALQQEINELNDKIREMREGAKGLDEEFDNATGAGEFFTRSLADGLDQVLFRARSVEDAIKGIIRQLASRALTTGIMGLLGGGFGGSFFGAMFGGNRASGGHVEPGRGYIVGERGPEMFYPQSSGTIASNQQMEGSSKKIDLRVHVTGDLVDRNGQIRSAIQEQSRQIQRLQ